MGADERGATLLLVIGFVLIVGAMSSAILTLLLSGAGGQSTVANARNREYEADGAIEKAIAEVRSNMPTHPTAPCPWATTVYPQAVLPNGAAVKQDVQVDCTYHQSWTLSGFLQRNVVFVACAPQNGGTCGSAALISAQVNFQSPDSASAPPPINVTKTFVQSWSVNQ